MTLLGIFSECARLAEGAGAGAVASVARRRGSLPMSGSAKMLVTAGGARIGTVGGGVLEAEITERAMAVIEQRTPAISNHTLNAEIAGNYGLTCGGTAVMFIEPVFVDATLARVYAECAGALARGERAVLATSADLSKGIAKVVLTTRGTIGTVDAILTRAAARLDPRAEVPTLDEHVLVEPVVGSPRLVVFGGGHVGAKVAEAAAFTGWRVTVIDERAEFSDPARFPFAERTVTSDYSDLTRTLELDGDTYAVVATRGHQQDAAIVEQLARLGLRYLGMLGSKRKVILTWNLLAERGMPRELLDRIHAPVGLTIGADTPAEIAISVVAQMVAVRRAGRVAAEPSLSS
jgi:xanthine dehydrogenase accessory factor